MKTFLSFTVLALLVMSCDIDVEPRYDPALRVTGTYLVDEFSHTYEEYTSYDIHVYQTGYDRVKISNFYGVGIDVDAEVRGNLLVIPYQVRNGYEVEGSATIRVHELNFSYSVRDLYEHRSPRNYCDAEAWVY